MAINKELYQTNSLEEKIYSGSIENNQKELKPFFAEIIERRRGEDPVNDGLQASIIITKDRFAAKINENDR